MTRFDIIPVLLFGIVLGVLIMLGVDDPQQILPICWIPSITPSLIPALTTIVVGWWIHTAVRRRGELDKIQIDYLSDVNQRIRQLVSDCLRSEGEKQVVPIRQLSIEISHLREIARRRSAELGSLEQDLVACYIDFKTHLTDSAAIDKGIASKASGEIRMNALKIQWRLSKRLLENTKDADMF